MLWPVGHGRPELGVACSVVISATVAPLEDEALVNCAKGLFEVAAVESAGVEAVFVELLPQPVISNAVTTGVTPTSRALRTGHLPDSRIDSHLQERVLRGFPPYW